MSSGLCLLLIFYSTSCYQMSRSASKWQTFRVMYQRILNSLRDFFGISRKEARGALVLLALCMVIIWSPFVFRRWVLPMVQPASPPIEMRVLDSIALLLDQKHVRAHPDYPKREERGGAKPRLFNFDPNKSSAEDLAELGIPAFLVKRIDKFRSKGGRFRKREDLMKIYDFPADLYARLQPHIFIENQDEPRRQVRQYLARPGSETAADGRFVNIPQTFDINQCDTTRLIRLRGIGSKLAQRILKFRDGLGGFHSNGQFDEIYGLDSLALSELKKYAQIGTGVRKININTATAEELGRHSYLRNRKMVSVLVNYRDQHGPFTSLDALRNVKVLDEATIQKIGPYLSF